MARTARVKSTADGTAYYHLTSRACNRQFLFRKAKVKTRLAEFIRIAAEFSGVVLEAFTVMDNHIHVLCKIVRGGVVTQEEIIRRIALLKGAKVAEDLSRRWDAMAASGLGEELEKELGRYRRRMDDISEFMKTLKETFAIWFNKEYGYSGSVWSGVFKSTMVEGGRYLEYCRRYVSMNPIRAGIVSQEKDYPWTWRAERGYFAGDCVPVFTGSRRVAQLTSGKIFGSAAFVAEWARRLGAKFPAASVVARAVGDIGFATHGWRLAKRDEAAAA